MVSKRSAGGWPLVAAFAAAAVLGASLPVFAASAPAAATSNGAATPAGPVVVSGTAATPTLLWPRPALSVPPAPASVGPSLRATPVPATASPPLHFTGQLRVRHESRGVLDYRLPGTFGRPAAQSAGAGGDVSFVRTRVGANAKLAPRVLASFGLEDARTLGIAGSGGGTFSTLDVAHAWVELDSLGSRSVSARVGRQPLACSGNRILGGSEWSRRGRAYDGARVRWMPGHAAVEGFVAQVHDAGSGAMGRVLSGIDAQWRSARCVEAEGYHLERAYAGAATSESGHSGGLFDATTGLRTRARLGSWELRTEGAVQRGRRAGDPVGAWFGVARVTAFLSSAWRTRIAFERLSASGDRSPADGTSQRFEPLERSGAEPPDALAIRGFSNVVDWCGALTAQTAPAWTVQAELHQLSLASATDAWVDAEGSVVRRDPAGGSGTGLGRELDVRVTWEAGPRASVVGVASRFSAGPFVQATGGGGAASGGWLQFVVGF